MHQTNDRHGSHIYRGLNALLQLSHVQVQEHGTVDLLHLPRHEGQQGNQAHCHLHSLSGSGNEVLNLSASEVMWVVKHCSTTAIKDCLAKSTPRMSTRNLQLAFDNGVHLNNINLFTAELLMMNGVFCSDEHLESAVDYCNLHMLRLLVTYCRSWRPSELVSNLQNSTNDPNTMKIRLQMVKWTVQWMFQRGLPYVVEGDPENISSYKLLVGVVTSSGGIERSCKVVPLCA